MSVSTETQFGNLRWWDRRYSGPQERSQAIFRWVNHIMTRQTLRYQSHLYHAQLYEDLPALGLQPYNYTDIEAGSDWLRLNVVRSVIDTYVSLVSRSKPKPKVLTDKGDWMQQKRAKGLTRWYEGKAEEIELYREVSGPCARDSAVFGLGVAKILRDDWEDPDEADVGVERIFPWEMLVDDAEAQTPRRLRTIGHRQYRDRAVLAEMFPRAKAYIETQASRSDSMVTGYDIWFTDTAADLIPVVEVWHLPTRKGANDGRHVIAIEGTTLYDGPWTRNSFPFAFLYRSRPTMGLWGVSIPHELRGAQQHINTTLLDIEECLHLYAKPKWMVPAGSVIPSHLDDDLDSIIQFQGQVPPTVYSPKAMPDEQYTFLWQIWQKCFDQIGVSQARSEGETAPGLSGSGASIRAWNDVGDGRFYDANNNYEDWHMRIFAAMVDEAREIAEDNPDYASTWRGKKYVEIVKFRDVDPGKDKYFMQTFPESRLSSFPAQRLAQIQELFNSGIISPKEFRALADFPDLEAEDSLANAPKELSDQIISKFLEAEDPDAPEVMVYPESEWPIADIKVRMQYALVRAELDEVPEGNLRLFRNFLRLCDAPELSPPPPGQAPPGAPSGMVPGAPPAAPPPALMPGQAMPAPPRAA